MPNITKLAEKYIKEHPSIKDCLKKGLVNYSSLSRQISNETGIKQFDAILIACRRFSKKLKKESVLEDKIIEVLKKSKIETKNKIIAIVLEKDIFFNNLIDIEKEIKRKNDVIHIIESVNAITVVTTEDYLEKIEKTFKNKILSMNKDLVEITIKSPKELETIPGVASYLFSLFSEYGVNIVETMSCWTDTLFVIKEQDIGKIMQVLKF